MLFQDRETDLNILDPSKIQVYGRDLRLMPVYIQILHTVKNRQIPVIIPCIFGPGIDFSSEQKCLDLIGKQHIHCLL